MKTKLLILLTGTFLGTVVYGQAPAIASFSPLNGTVDASVSRTGTGICFGMLSSHFTIHI